MAQTNADQRAEAARLVALRAGNLWYSEYEHAGDRLLELLPALLADAEALAAMERAERGAPQASADPTRACPYCGSSLGRHKGGRTCGQSTCMRAYEKDRLWWSRHRVEVEDALTTRIGAEFVLDIHPARARALCANAGIKLHDGRGRPKKINTGG